ncbi:ASN_HP2_G0038100.mRNA.1.CDS.1 [Saccharomyces cerevisiae]|nr:BGN_3a_G0039610.mRNA.1.CDS.1 [Saccharomyces cerevisiae]CAI5284629.1 ASN_HP2_G0038100.mRNA.1.CDS.1 [Saccharomyces cerevisiae]CAI5310109.1 BFH_HP2_G0039200.mRNA.1.CDS.1 [Saccharomyces cerevisiae]CAI6566393.1 ASN_HP2_G0038100.mRNA.1.CDS.1 [Saccharomyces cerevisiae]CAI6602758.1 ASN_HP1_G0039050.mRNA.1.CDS.1 [Saccharomyces cerevisiae]
MSANVQEAANAAIEPASFVKVPMPEPPSSLQQLINDWQLIKHREGGYFKETDRSPYTMEVEKPVNGGSGNTEMITRNQSTLIYYLLTPDSPIGKFHKNINRIIHILQRGKGQYVLVYPDGQVKSFKVGFDYKNGEVSQWVVPGGVFKASFLLPNEEFDNGFLISEVVVPGFDFEDHTFLKGEDELKHLVGPEKAAELAFLA